MAIVYVVVVVVVIGVALSTAAAMESRSGQVQENSRRIKQHEIVLDTGERVDCLVYSGGGISCDWSNKRYG